MFAALSVGLSQAATTIVLVSSLHALSAVLRSGDCQKAPKAGYSASSRESTQKVSKLRRGLMAGEVRSASR